MRNSKPRYLPYMSRIYDFALPRLRWLHSSRRNKRSRRKFSRMQKPQYASPFRPVAFAFPILTTRTDVESLQTSRFPTTVVERHAKYTFPNIGTQTACKGAPTYIGSQLISANATTFPRSEFSGNLRGRRGGIFSRSR